jgi:predicted dehydrogenase
VVAFGIPTSVTGIFRNERADGHEEPDCFTAILDYGAAGPVVTVGISVMSITTEPLRLWVRGTSGSYRKYHFDCQEGQLKDGMLPGQAGFGIEEPHKAGQLTVLRDGKPELASLPDVVPKTYSALYAGFAEALAANDEALVPVKASEARDVLRVIETVMESARQRATIPMQV